MNSISRGDKLVLVLLILLVFLVLPTGWGFFVLLVKKGALTLVVALLALVAILILRFVTPRR